MKRVGYPTQQRPQSEPTVPPPAAECLRGEELHLGKPSPVILRSPLTPPDAVSPRVPGRTPDRGRGKGTPPCLTQRSLLRNSEMVMSPQEEHEPSTKASSAC